MDDMFVYEYVNMAGQLNAELKRLTQGYCAESCPGLPAGCCTEQSFNVGSVPLLSRLQREEAQNNGWTQTPGNCQYHNPEQGCALDRTKTPLCLGALCEPVRRYLRGTHGQQAEPFINVMETLEGRSLGVEYPQFVLHTVAAALEQAKKLTLS